MNEIQLLHEALNLIYVYNHGGEKIQEDIKKKGYNKRAVSYYFPVLVRYSPAFSSYYQKTFNKPAASIQSQIKTYVKKMLKQKTSEDDLDVIDIFLYKCYKDQTNYNKLWQTTQPRGMFSANELTQLERYGQEPNGPGAALILASLLRNNQEEGVKEPTINDLVAKITDTTKISEEDKKKAAELLKNKIKLYEKYIKDPKLHEQLIKKGFLTQAELDSIVKSGLVSVKGIEPEFNKTGLKTAEEREKATLEAAERLLKSEIEKREALEKKTPPPTPPTPPSPPSPIILPRPNIRPLFSGLNIQIHNLSNKVITSGLPIMSNAVRGAGNQAANGASSLLKGGSNIFRNLDQFKGSRVATRGIVVSLFIALFIVIAIMSFTGIGGEAAPLPPGYGGEDISSCKFTRSDQNPKETAFQSPRLLSYIQEASRLSGIPAAVLAAFMRVEVPSVAYKTDNSLASIGCPKSTTGALGLMQLQPKGTTGHDGPAIAQGAKLIGKTYDELTEADYCDLQKNIIMGAGFILKKMSYKDYGDGTRWDPAWTNDKKTFEVLVDGYYGCHLYGGPKDCTGPFNYAEDVWTSVQNCKPTSTTPPSLPPPGGDLRVAIENQFNVKFDNSSGFSNEVLGWAWEALARANSAPNFFPLLKPKGLVTITSSSGVGNTSGNTVFISTSAITAGKNFFEQNLIHELAHVIHGTRDDTTYSTQPAVSKDGGYISGYAQGATADPDFACKTTNSKETNVQLDEDFAETVSYYINVNIPEQNYSKTNSCPPRSTTINPLSSGKYSEHIKYIKNILGGNNF